MMIRNRRADTGIEWTKRLVETIPIEFTNEERDLYDSISGLRSDGDWMTSSQFSLMTLQREACSSREAVYFTLKICLKTRIAFNLLPRNDSIINKQSGGDSNQHKSE